MSGFGLQILGEAFDFGLAHGGASGLQETNAHSLPHRRWLRPCQNQCGGIGMKTGGGPDILPRALMSASLAPWGFK